MGFGCSGGCTKNKCSNWNWLALGPPHSLQLPVNEIPKDLIKQFAPQAGFKPTPLDLVCWGWIVWLEISAVQDNVVEEEATRFSPKNTLISHAFSLKPSIIIKNWVVFPIHKFYLCPCMNIGRSIFILLYNRDALQFRPLFYLNHFKGLMARSTTNKS